MERAHESFVIACAAEPKLIRIDPGAGLIRVDRVQIQQVVVNLLRNALEAVAMRSGVRAEVVIEACPTGSGMVEIAVTDNGPGFAPEVLQLRHRPFLSTKPGGMGIGLSICRRIVEAHGGAMLMENRAEGGGMLRFTVPGADDAEAVAA